MCPCKSCGGDPRSYVRPHSYEPAEIVAECRLVEGAEERERLYDEIRAQRQPVSAGRPILAWTRVAV